MFRQTTDKDGTTTLRCTHCGTSRQFRLPHLVTVFKRDHPQHECPARRPTGDPR